MRDHGGNLDWAQARWGGKDWIDLSTGINRVPYPVPPLPPDAFTALPRASDMAALLAAARAAYGTTAPILALNGAQAAIQMVPLLAPPGIARIVSPTYNEHAATLRACDWRVEAVPDLSALAGADLAVVVNPNNPDGRRWSRAALLDLLPKVGRLVIDESFADPDPIQSLASEAHRPGLLVLKSFGKFYGLAGLRLGFVLGPKPDIARLQALSGPWPVSGPALHIGSTALADRDWAAATTARLTAETPRLDAIADRLGWSLIGGTDLFRTYATPSALEAQARLASLQIWSRIFPYSATWLRLGLPGSDAEWARLDAVR